MVFSSTIFIFGFLPVFLATYYSIPKTLRSAWILVASYGFYGWWRVEYLVVVFVICLVSYVAATGAIRFKKESLKKWSVWVGIGLDLAVLGYFKYSFFVLDNVGAFVESIGGPQSHFSHIILPIGISFLTFQSISYILDVARGDAKPARNLIHFLAFSSLFPQLIAGPILRYKDVADQFVSRVHSFELFAFGCRRFVVGLAMKLLIADTLAPMSDRMFALSSPTLAEAWLGAGAYSIQLLFDFAGYSAMAIGLGLMIGFRFVENFDVPYSSSSVTEFWRRWHISLSNWLRDYLYIPLGGNRGGTLKTYRNLMLTMVLGGLWHGANWTFFLWGAWHGLFLSIERLIMRQGSTAIWPTGLGWLCTMLIVLIGWVMFRALTVMDAIAMYAGMIGLNGYNISVATVYFNQPTEYLALAIGIAILCRVWSFFPLKVRPLPEWHSVAPVALFFCCTFILNARSHSPFLYFQF